MSTPTLFQLMGQALDAERLGQFDKARDLLRQAIALEPSSGSLDARLCLGKLLIYGGAPTSLRPRMSSPRPAARPSNKARLAWPPPPSTCWRCWNAAAANSTGPPNCSSRAPCTSRPRPPAPPWGSGSTTAAWSRPTGPT